MTYLSSYINKAGHYAAHDLINEKRHKKASLYHYLVEADEDELTERERYSEEQLQEEGCQKTTSQVTKSL